MNCLRRFSLLLILFLNLTRSASAYTSNYETVSLAGTFNNWNLSASHMKLVKDYAWEGYVYLYTNQIEFKFVGDEAWTNAYGDSTAITILPHTGTVALATGNASYSGHMYGWYRFSFNETNSQYVFRHHNSRRYSDFAIAGTFNGWNLGLTPMAEVGDHEWETDIYLDTNSVSFKFVGDGNWSNAYGDASAVVSLPHMGVANLSAADITYSGSPFGFYHLTFNESNRVYTFKHNSDRLYDRISVAGTFNGWNTSSNLLSYTSNGWWTGTAVVQHHDAQFKFVANQSWAVASWGDSGVYTQLPWTGTVSTVAGNVVIPGCYDLGAFEFRFNEDTLKYSVSRLPVSPVGMYIAGTFNSWSPGTLPMNEIAPMVFEVSRELVITGNNLQFKFIIGGDWTIGSFGAVGQTDTDDNHTGNVATNGADILSNNISNGLYTFRIDLNNCTYAFSRDVIVDTDMDGMPDTWEDANGLNRNVNDAGGDADLDGMTNLEEFIAGTNPQQSSSHLKVQRVPGSETNEQQRLEWPSAPGRYYLVECTTNLQDAASWTWLPPEKSISGPGPLLNLSITSSIARSYYRVRVTTGDTDGLDDEWEHQHGLSPFTGSGSDGPGGDPDGDNLLNAEEFLRGTNPNSSDSDYDGLSDFDEVNQYNTDPARADTDGDFFKDGYEVARGLNPHSYHSYGAPGAGGIFRAYAPQASGVSITYKSFANGWSNEVVMTKESNGEYWSVVHPLPEGTEFQYKFAGVSARYADPRSRMLMDPTNVFSGVVIDTDSFTWEDAAFEIQPTNRLVVYELHFGTFSDASPNGGSTIADAIEKLDYLQQLGINAIEVMPVYEVAGLNRTLGYSAANHFSVERNYIRSRMTNAAMESIPDPRELKKFVNECHKRNIGVILDADINKFAWGSASSPAAYSNRSPIISFGQDPGTFYQFGVFSSGSIGGYGGVRPNFANPATYWMIHDSMMTWVHEYHIDGFRYDAVNEITGYPNGAAMLAEINDRIKKQGRRTVLWAEFSGYNNENGLDAQWINDYWDDSGGSFWAQANMLDSTVNSGLFSEHFTSKPYKRTSDYSNHNMAKNNGHKMAIIGCRRPEKSEFWLQQRIGVLAGAQMTGLKVPYFFMGEEFLMNIRNNLPANSCPTAGTPNSHYYWWDDIPMDWSRTNSQANFVRMFSDLATLRRDAGGPTLGLQGGSATQSLPADTFNDVVIVRKWDAASPTNDVMLVFRLNDDGADMASYQMGVPAGGNWKTIYDSSWYITGGVLAIPGVLPVYSAGPVSVHGYSNAISIPIKRHSFKILVRSP